MHPTRQTGDDHWTRRAPELRVAWAKLPTAQLDELAARYQAGETQSALARAYQVGRTTVWRYLKARGLL